MKFLLFIGVVVFSIKSSAQTATTLQCVTILNQARKASGLDTVKFSKELTKNCLNHAKYLTLNKNNVKTEGLLCHKEFKELKGYSKEGASAAAHSDICQLYGNADTLPCCIGNFLCTFYHRIPLLEPNLTEVGLAYYSDSSFQTYVLDCTSKIKSTKINSGIDIVYYPAKDQKNVPIIFEEETPNPVPDSLREQPTIGFPITVYFANWQKVKNVTFLLNDDKDNPVDCFLSTPEKPAIDFHQRNSICAIPKKVLKNNTKYFVSVNCIVNDSSYTYAYSFTTVAEKLLLDD